VVRCCMFTDALLAHVGLSESEPQREGIMGAGCKTADERHPADRGNGREAGFTKLLIGDDDRILGFTMIGSEAGAAMAAERTRDAVCTAIHGTARRGHRSFDDRRGPRSTACPLGRVVVIALDGRQ